MSGPRKLHPQVRIIGTPEQIAAIQRVLNTAACTMPGWQMVRQSPLRPRRDERGRDAVYLVLQVGDT